MAQKRVALLAGCNYEGKSCALSGCINDVKSVKEVLKTRFDFEESNITLLTDERGTPAVSQPSGFNIMEKLKAMAKASGPDDLLLFYFSGHGTKISSSKDEGNEYEAIVPSDFNLITKFDFRNLVNEVKNGTTFVLITDSCHSGGLIEKEEMQIRDLKFESHKSTKSIEQEAKAKMIEHEELKQILGIQDIYTHLKDKFKSEASYYVHDIRDYQKPIPKDMGILISACRSEEVSLDLKESFGGKPDAHGAFTTALLSVLQKDRNLLTNKQVVEQVRELLVEKNFDQHPCLYCVDNNVTATFLLQKRAVATEETEVLYQDPSFTPASNAKCMHWDLLDEITQTALAYFVKSSDATQEKIKMWFKELETDQDNKVKAKDVHKILVQKKGCDSEALSRFIGNKIRWDTRLDLNQALALYYTSKSLVEYCRKCGKFLNSLYFVCVSCFTSEKEEFNICPQCLKGGAKCQKPFHEQFVDNNALLQYYHLIEVKSSKGIQHLQNGSPEEINKCLEEAETSFHKHSHLNEDMKRLAKSKKLDRTGLSIDSVCSIM